LIVGFGGPLDQRPVSVPLRETRGIVADLSASPNGRPNSRLLSILRYPAHCPLSPPFAMFKTGSRSAPEGFAGVHRWIAFLGNKNIALFAGAAISLWVLARRRGLSFRAIEDLIGPPIETAGVIILITSAGGAFGLMLRNAGVGDAIAWRRGFRGQPVVLSWLVAAVIRTPRDPPRWPCCHFRDDLPDDRSRRRHPARHPIYIFLATASAPSTRG
jgi:hypothetical protein